MVAPKRFVQIVNVSGSYAFRDNHGSLSPLGESHRRIIATH
jgi:hypothetical protein